MVRCHATRPEACQNRSRVRFISNATKQPIVLTSVLGPYAIRPPFTPALAPYRRSGGTHARCTPLRSTTARTDRVPDPRRHRQPAHRPFVFAALQRHRPQRRRSRVAQHVYSRQLRACDPRWSFQRRPRSCAPHLHRQFGHGPCPGCLSLQRCSAPASCRTCGCAPGRSRHGGVGSAQSASALTQPRAVAACRPLLRSDWHVCKDATLRRSNDLRSCCRCTVSRAMFA